MKFEVFDEKNKVKDLKLSKIWDETSDKVLNQVVVSRLANERLGNANTKTRSEVNGGGKKPWKQKGLGRARAGSSRSPLWPGGGVTFGPKPRDFSQKINQKQKVKAYLYAIAKMNELGNVKVIEEFKVPELKTQAFIKTLSKFEKELNKKIVVIVDEYNKDSYLASRNLPNVRLMTADMMDILPLAYADKIVVTEKALMMLDEKFNQILG